MRRATIEERLATAQQHDQRCLLCEHRCAINRAAAERGECKAGIEARVFRHRIECGEEPELVPCHLFYLSGCDLRCAFCIAEANAFDPGRGRILTPDFFRAAATWGQQQGARTLQWVGGEPTIHLPRILEAMQGCEALPPIVWKSDFHGTPEVFELLDGLVTTYVADFKFGNDHCAQRIARVPNYWSILTRNLRIASRQGRLIVRHLLMPGHHDCCFVPVLRWLTDELPEAALSLRDGYLPRWRAASEAKGIEELSRRLRRDEVEQARALARQSGLEVLL
ncbi:radical SAM protein [Planctomyces sp. SH-PL14]|uniref:radical SAM protein n=1 Tax=Planctomyces sp. SH-PL14 TaxID=1632864 RepID=UPI00078D2F20|nr:radical SAM protein [Planctomyces sp. SH-PL14]AMV19808.1 Radical SAM superfamily protein [Planctomyces sp. SH-PL14]